MTQTRLDEIMARRADERKMLEGVDALAFHAFESNARYHAIGVYRILGKLTARCVSDSFFVRVPETARELYLQTAYEENAARMIQAQFTGLPPVLASLIDRAVAEELLEGPK